MHPGISVRGAPGRQPTHVGIRETVVNVKAPATEERERTEADVTDTTAQAA